VNEYLLIIQTRRCRHRKQHWTYTYQSTSVFVISGECSQSRFLEVTNMSAVPIGIALPEASHTTPQGPFGQDPELPHGVFAPPSHPKVGLQVFQYFCVIISITWVPHPYPVHDRPELCQYKGRPFFRVLAWPSEYTLDSMLNKDGLTPKSFFRCSGMMSAGRRL
jgi:hypothetical protein